MKTILVAASLLTALAPFVVTSVAADHNTCPTTHDLRGTVTGSVSAVDRDYWRLQIGPIGGSGALTPGDLTSATSGIAIVLESYDGDADLYVWDADCDGLPVCKSTNGGLVTDRCTITKAGTYYVEPQYWFDSDGTAEYVLTAEAWPV